MRKIILVASVPVLLAAVRMAVISGIFNNNTIFLAGIAAAIWLYGHFFDRLKKIKILTAVICAVVFLFIGMSAFLAVYGGRSTVNYSEDVVLVLGGGVRRGEVQSNLQMRLEMAVAYHHRNPDALIIVTGGTGHREPYSEAEVMARYLISRGIPEEIILREEASYSTYTNMAFSRVLFDTYIAPLGIFYETPTAVIITNDFHMFRSVSFAEGAGFYALAYPAGTPWYNVPFFYAREVAAVIKMWVVGR